MDGGSLLADGEYYPATAQPQAVPLEVEVHLHTSSQRLPQRQPSGVPSPLASHDTGLPTHLPPDIGDKMVLRNNLTRYLPGGPARNPRT
jgi:hypothetical protein